MRHQNNTLIDASAALFFTLSIIRWPIFGAGDNFRRIPTVSVRRSQTTPIARRGPNEAKADCACPPGPGARGLGEAPICGHHEDIWGFMIDLPRGSCGDPYLHGVLLTIPGARDTAKRNITVFAANNAMFYHSARELARASQKANVRGAWTVLESGRVSLGGMSGERWLVRSIAHHQQVVSEEVYILRRVNAAQNELPDYEYTFSLVTSPAFYKRDHEVFARILRSVAFTTPER